MAKARTRVVVSGRVQGVAFREATRRRAESRGVSGWVRNLPDGRVEALFEGDDETVRTMVEWCHRGPSMALVERVDVQDESYTGEFDGFDIVHGPYW